MLRPAAALFSLLLSLSSFAATLGPERRVAPIPPLTRAADAQGAADVATDGHGFVAVWTDLRAVHDQIGAGSAIYASHLTADGAAEPLTGIRLGDGNSAHIASSGDGYLVAWSNFRMLYSQRLDTNGRAVGSPLALPTNADAFPQAISLGSNGRGYLVAFQNGGAGFERLLLDTNGRPISSAIPLGGAVDDVHRDDG
jgi:hypothetical protein